MVELLDLKLVVHSVDLLEMNWAAYLVALKVPPSAILLAGLWVERWVAEPAGNLVDHLAASKESLLAENLVVCWAECLDVKQAACSVGCSVGRSVVLKVVHSVALSAASSVALSVDLWVGQSVAHSAGLMDIGSAVSWVWS